MRFQIFAVILALAMLAPVGAAASDRTFEFTATPNTGALAGTFSLVDADQGNGDPVTLPANVGVVWASPTKLAAPVHFVDGAFSVDLYLTNAKGTVRAIWGYMELEADNQYHFVPLKASDARNVNAMGRSVAAGLGIPVTSSSLDVGHASVPITGVEGVFPAGTYPAVTITSSNNNALYTHPTTLGASGSSTATVPLPELPAVILMALGVGAIGAVALVRRQKGWI